jgi:hypothetical protein
VRFQPAEGGEFSTGADTKPASRRATAPRVCLDRCEATVTTRLFRARRRLAEALMG